MKRAPQKDDASAARSSAKGGRQVEVSDNPIHVWLSPERCRAGRALLNWSVQYLARKAAEVGRIPILASELSAFEDFGEALDVRTSAAVLAALLAKLEFTTAEGEPGVVRKRVAGQQAAGWVQFGGARKRRPPL